VAFAFPLMIHICLVEPEIPQNTGNIVRTCAATGAVLHLVRPLGFSLDDRYMKRAGLDYFSMARVIVHDAFDELKRRHPEIPMVFFTTKGARPYTEYAYEKDVMLVFGRETYGLPEALLRKFPGQCARIPMREGARSLNLSNSVAIALYEVLRQRSFEDLQCEGKLTGREEPVQPWLDYL
jgi:tRNA (cytidine/uridine-2'-O-)-methyltransferase